MMAQWKSLSLWCRFGFLVGVMLVCLLVIHFVMWDAMSDSIKQLEGEVSRLDQESRGLTQKTESLKTIEKDVNSLRENLATRVQQFPENIESKIFRRDVIEIAKRRNVTIRVWKPEPPLTELQHSEFSIPIVLRVEGDFQGTVQFLDDLRQLAWVEGIPSITLAGKPDNEHSPLVSTNLVMHGLTPLGIEHVQQLLRT
ncbi:type 4a pilus biogenesis protein PilO [Nitrospira sp. T9]|uniref:type 4a pilus biogenesis protein PilO n=1 Tax=unclassified Nitrospira TaxID=2652172 RepID=UPI003F947314